MRIKPVFALTRCFAESFTMTVMVRQCWRFYAATLSRLAHHAGFITRPVPVSRRRSGRESRLQHQWRIEPMRLCQDSTTFVWSTLGWLGSCAICRMALVACRYHPQESTTLYRAKSHMVSIRRCLPNQLEYNKLFFNTFAARPNELGS